MKNEITKWIKSEEKRNSWIIILLTRPSVYLNVLIKRTIMMGFFLFVIYEVLNGFNIGREAMPPTFHSIVGIVIGLLLVFRTNTAYDRWWEARKLFASIHSGFMFLRISAYDTVGESIMNDRLVKMNKFMFDFLSEEDKDKCIVLRNGFIEQYSLILNYIKQQNLSSHMERKMVDIMECFCSLERIKNTPIPLSYSLHIKLSIFAYLLILPFSLFFGMGLLAIPLVMILFFIIAGIEIISNEIENPFRGDPNDLPMEKLKMENEKFIDEYGRK